MTRKKKEIKVIHVKKPKIGETYFFFFAGSINSGVITRISEKLTKHYGYDYFIIEATSQGSKGDARIFKYPVSIYDIRKTNPYENK